MLLGVMLLAQLGAPPTAASTNDSDDIVLGMSTALTGPAADLGLEMHQGVVAGLERANRTGGIRGKKIRLIALDDGYEPSRTAPNMRQLLEKNRVLAVIGNVGTPTGVTAVPIANEQRTLFFAPFTGAGAFRKTPPDRYVVNFRASYAQEAAAIVDALISAGIKKEDIAIFTQRDAYGDAGYSATIAALKRHGLSNENQIVHVRYERNTLLVEDALATVLYAQREPRAIVMVGAYAPCAKFIQLAHEAGLHAIFHNVSFVGSASLAAELGRTPATVVVTQVVPHPEASETRLLQEYRADLKEVNGHASPCFGSLEGYIAARILLLALEKTRETPSRESLVEALEGLGRFELGLDHPLNLSPTNHQACHHVWLTKLSGGAMLPVEWSEFAGLVPVSQSP